MTDGEVATVLGPAAVVAAGVTFGSLTEITGGQCVWTDDPGGDAFASGATQLELVVYVPGGPNPPPAEAPTAGGNAVVPTESGVWFAAADRVFWLRVTGHGADEVGKIAGTRALAPVIASRS